jgi:hypothetical protein
MPQTPVYGLHYQALSDAPHGPNLGANLANDVEAQLVRIDGVAAMQPDIQVLVASANYVKPAGARVVHYKLIGSGAAGGGAVTNAAGSSAMGAGGGAGEFVEGWVDASTLADLVALTVGAAGTGVSGAAGNNGGDVVWNGITAKGGTGGPTRSTSAVAFGQGGGAGGTGGGGAPQIRIPGQSGETCWGSGALGISGAGGSTPYGAGGRGIRTNSEPTSSTGNAGLGMGAGGGGAITAGTGAAVAGGAGAIGGAIFETYF